MTPGRRRCPQCCAAMLPHWLAGFEPALWRCGECGRLFEASSDLPSTRAENLLARLRKLPYPEWLYIRPLGVEVPGVDPNWGLSPEMILRVVHTAFVKRRLPEPDNPECFVVSVNFPVGRELESGIRLHVEDGRLAKVILIDQHCDCCGIHGTIRRYHDGGVDWFSCDECDGVHVSRYPLSENYWSDTSAHPAHRCDWSVVNRVDPEIGTLRTSRFSANLEGGTFERLYSRATPAPHNPLLRIATNCDERGLEGERHVCLYKSPKGSWLFPVMHEDFEDNIQGLLEPLEGVK